uniref:Metalloendopeptidase n=1 Tax=Latimeria chalumnae TaxID=7897 RepID=H3AYJ7_LATCH
MSLQVLLILTALFCHSQSTPNSDRIENEKQGKEEEETRSVFAKIMKANKGNRTLRFGDIVVDTMRSAIACPKNNCYWPKDSDGFIKVPYKFSKKYTSEEKGTILESMTELQTMTCVRFVTRTNEVDYVNIVPEDGCFSSVGKDGGKQTLSLTNDGCLFKGVIQHELNHALGFEHEQNRSDRDKYVRIEWDNIEEGYEDNFIEADTNNLGLPYDYRSIMHYGRYEFSYARGKPTIVPIPNSKAILGEVDGFTNLDYLKLNRLYDCKVCSTMLFEWSGSMSSYNYPLAYANNISCLWLIRTPKNQVRLDFYGFDIQPSTDCSKDYIKIYDGDSKASRVLLDKSCGKKQLPSLIASTNMMLIEFVTDDTITASGFAASYRTGKCGGTLTDKIGEFTSPNYPRKYPRLIECSWTIVAPTGYRISVEMKHFNIEYSFECVYDVVVIRDGGTDSSPVKGKYCGWQKISTFTSTRNSVMVELYSDDYVTESGFLASYTMIPPS